jgi:signal transduction histidine kinase
MTRRLSVRLFYLALAAIYMFAIAGLTAADRALGRAERAETALDAAETTAKLESFVEVHAAALAAMHGLFSTPDQPVEAARFDALARSIAEYTSGFRRVWIADSADRILVSKDYAVQPHNGAPPGTDLDTVLRLDTRTVVARARATRRPQTSRPGPLISGDTGFFLVVPIFSGDTFLGLAGGSVSSRTLAERFATNAHGNRVGLGVDVAGVRVLRIGNADVGTSVADTVRLLGDTPWIVTVTHAPVDRPLRVALWTIGLLVLGALTYGLLHERRQALRITDRSTELERLSEELLRANRAKSEFLANVSHELRTPLNAIVGFADLLRDGVYGELAPRQAGPVNRIEASATHLRHLVDQVLDLAKMAAGRLEVHPELLDLRPFVFDVASEVEALVTEKGLSLSLAVGATLPRLRTDPTHLRQILINLLGNAVKYTVAGSVSVRARLTGPRAKLPATGRGWGSDVPTPPLPGSLSAEKLYVTLQVVDTGIGVAEGDLERIFDEFEQVNAGPRGESMQRGTGLGLSISRRLARLIGGDLTLESEVGRGSTFTLWLPVNEADVKVKEEPRAVAAV